MRMICSILLCLIPAIAPAQQASSLAFEVTLDPKVSAAPCTGRLHVVLTATKDREARLGINWFKPEPAFAIDVKEWKPGTTRMLTNDAVGYPVTLDKLEKKTYSIQAVLDVDKGWSRHYGTSPGNYYSKPVSMSLDPAMSGTVKLTLDQVVPERAFKETERVKLVEVESKLLTKFHGKRIVLHAGVVLPKGYAETTKKYPVVYEIPGFGGNHHMAFGRAERDATAIGGVDFLYVVLDPDCSLGHHVFADSANNGPCGQALIEELIPQIEKKFRALGRSEGRFVTGHSSGGWSSLWLQVTYPDFFGGVWSTSPDPVDFRDFQRINLYQPGVNMFTDANRQPRPIARSKAKPVLWYKGFSDMEEPFGRGGQLSSFEGVFSPRGADGKPRKLWDRKTGAVDLDTAKSWEKYDIRLVLERNWPALKPKLNGKLHVYMGDQDTFYLEGATRLLKESLTKLGSDAKVELFEGKDHGSIMDKALRERIAREMAAQYQRSQASLR